MGKKIIILTLLALILAAAMVEYFYVDGASQRLTALLEDVKDALDAGDAAQAKTSARQFTAQWDDEKQRLEALYEHNEVDVISATAQRIEVFCDGEDTVNALAEISAGLFYVSHLREMIGVTWENIL
jgi:hypothetical protein